MFGFPEKLFYNISFSKIKHKSKTTSKIGITSTQTHLADIFKLSAILKDY
jgi:hypothetical protein